MAITNVGGSYSSTASGASTRKGVSGLVSGLNTDEIIEAMTSGTTGKITKLQQNRQKFTWQTTAYRNITDKLIAFSQKYLSSSSSTNMMNSDFFENATINSVGANSGAVSIRGTSSSIKDFKIYGVSQMATTAGFTTSGLDKDGSGGVSSGRIESDAFSADMFGIGAGINKLEGEAINVKFNGTRYDIYLNDIDMNYTSDELQAFKDFQDAYEAGATSDKTPAQLAALSEKILNENPDIKSGLESAGEKTKNNVLKAINQGIEKAGLAGKISAEFSADGKTIGLKVNGAAEGAGRLEIAGIGTNAANYLGIQPGKTAEKGGTISGTVNLTDALSSVAAAAVTDIGKSLSGKSIVFDLDGVKKTITFDKDKTYANFGELTAALEQKLNTAFNGKVKLTVVGADGKPDPGGDRFALSTVDNTSILSLSSGAAGVTGGKGVLGLDVGDANRLLLDNSLDSMSGENLNGALSKIFGTGADGTSKTAKASFQYDSNGNITKIENADEAAGKQPATLNINGTEFKVYSNAIEITGQDGDVTNLRFDKGTSMRSIINAVNNSDAGVALKYNSTTDSFTMTATESGTYGRMEVGGSLAGALFGGDTQKLSDVETVWNAKNLDASSLDTSGRLDNETAGALMNIDGNEYRVFSDAVYAKRGDGTFEKISTAGWNKSDSNSLDVMISDINADLAGSDVSHPTTASITVSGGEVSIMGADGRPADVRGDLAGELFHGNRAVTVGQDSEVTVSFDGGKTLTQIKRSSNAFTMNGMDITLNSTFNEDGKVSDRVDANGNQIFEAPDGTALTGEVSFNAKMNTDDIVKNIKEMTESYNEIIKLVNGEYSTKPSRDYQPLTSEERQNMSESEITAWETKAKEGILFNDSDLSGLLSGLRFAFSMPIDGDMMSSIGIETSKNWEDNGRLVLNEDKLKKALEERPDDVKKMFAMQSNDGVSNDGGAMTRLKTTFDKYASTVGEKGILVQKAGNSAAPLSLLQNTIQTKIDAVDKQIKELQARLKTEQDRYYNQFTNLELYINQMNTQSSWLLQQNS